VAGAPTVPVDADPQRLTQALMQLASNAVRHTRPDTPIVFGAALAGERLHLWVSDRGTGIGAADQQRIFERFTRTSSSRRRGPGSGLGLAIVSAITTAHTGEVVLMSTEASGATFTLVLPVAGARVAS
jgi:signal transduction histidine kinase